MPTYRTKMQLDHNRQSYPIDSLIELTEEEAQTALNRGAIELVSEDTELPPELPSIPPKTPPNKLPSKGEQPPEK